MRFTIVCLSVLLLSFNSPFNNNIHNRVSSVEPKVKLVAPPSDSLSLKHLKVSKKTSDSKIASVKSKMVTGIASYYSAHLEGSKVAIPGERFSHKNDNIASNFFPLGTWVKITSVRNGKSVIARVNDRMHPRMAKRGRVVDLTINHAKALGFYKNGLTKVIVEVIDPEQIKESK